MATKSKVKILLLFIVMFIGYACSLNKKNSTDAELINIVEEYRNTFCALEIKQTRLRSNYYICEFNNGSTYIVSYDGQVIREAHGSLPVISENALEDKKIPDSMHKLSLLVINLLANEVVCIELKSDTIIFEKMDGYYLAYRLEKK